MLALCLACVGDWALQWRSAKQPHRFACTKARLRAINTCRVMQYQSPHTFVQSSCRSDHNFFQRRRACTRTYARHRQAHRARPWTDIQMAGEMRARRNTGVGEAQAQRCITTSNPPRRHLPAMQQQEEQAMQDSQRKRWGGLSACHTGLVTAAWLRGRSVVVDSSCTPGNTPSKRTSTCPVETPAKEEAGCSHYSHLHADAAGARACAQVGSKVVSPPPTMGCCGWLLALSSVLPCMQLPVS